jgi:N-acetylmuramoyl-L-alanine amidase
LFNSGVVSRARCGTLALLILIAALGLCCAPSRAQEARPEVLASRVTTTPERGRLILDLSGPTEFAIATLSEPNRIAVDVKAAGVAVATAQPLAGKGLVMSFATAMAEEGRVRTELVLNGPAMVQQAYVLAAVGDQPARLVVDLIPTTPEDFAARAAADLANAVSRAVPDAIAPPEEVAETPPSSEPPIEPLPPGSRPLIVLDPGHGGVDNGATAPSGVHEKNITLTFALQLRDLLVATGQFDVALTRDDDTYLTLNERVDVARQNKADLFISLHADTFQQADIRGASIYTRDERATDILKAVLAEGESHADIVSGYVQPDAPPAVVNILVDLMRRQVRQQAYLAAADIVKAMEPSVALRRFPVRQADFFVLQAPDIPSLLVELGFMSNAADAQNLESVDWRNRVVDAIAKGVAAYFTELRTPAP